jgi:NMD protein affecting ribosome stability and mRNA decay
MKLTVCSLCLRVRRGKTWIDAQGAIRELRSYELLELPRMDGAVCGACKDEISRRRAEIEQPLAA